jgi:c-di-GMP-binding flagellar brake protein YcgR
MKLDAILVCRNQATAQAVSRALHQFDVDPLPFPESAAAIQALSERPCDLLLVDLEDSEQAHLALGQLRLAPANSTLLTAALVKNEDKAQEALAQGAHFVLAPPFAPGPVHGVLQAVNALIRRDRRQSTRIPIQLPVSLSCGESEDIEAILLDLSEEGMDIIAAQALPAFVDVRFHFALPEDGALMEGSGTVAWVNPNGECGIRITEISEESNSRLQAWIASNKQSTRADEVPAFPCRLTDLSVGGCYAETESPLPLRTRVEVRMQAANLKTRLYATVTVMHPGHGMGLEFLLDNHDQLRTVEQLIDFLLSNPGTVPEFLVLPRELQDTMNGNGHRSHFLADVEDPLLDLLKSQHPMSREEFLEILRSQRHHPDHA